MAVDAATEAGPGDGKKAGRSADRSVRQALAGLPQDGQVMFKDCPHCSQNRASSLLA